MPYRRPISPVHVDALPSELVAQTLSLLLFLSDPKSQARAKVMLEALQVAVEANKKALAGFPAANRIAEAEEAAEADRAAAAQELADAKVKAEHIVADGQGEIDGLRANFIRQDGELAVRERKLIDGEAALKKRVADTARETAKLRAALNG